jgi:hypothetical protein
MTFAARETSRQKGLPFFCYLWRYDVAPGCHFAYTSAEQEVSIFINDDIGDILFTPQPITHGTITASAALDKSTLEVRTPKGIGLSEKFARWPPSKVITLMIFEGHVGEAETKMIWSGRTLAWRRSDSETLYANESSSTSMRRTGLRQNWQLPCNYVLYDPRTCKADMEAATSNAAVTDIQGARVTVAGDWSANQTKYASGFAAWECEDGRTEIRTIVRFESGTLHLSGRVADLSVGDTIRISFGCNHLYDDPLGCPLHNNKPNFGGEPFIPDENPIGVVNTFD